MSMLQWTKHHVAILLSIILILITLIGVTYADISSEVLKKFAEQEKYYQLPSEILAKVARIESNGNAKAGNPGRAYGLFQWLPRSWYDATQALYKQPKNLELRANPLVATEVTAFALAQIRSKNGSLFGGKANVDQYTGIYLGHLLGVSGGAKFLRALADNDATPATSIFGKEAASNPSIFCQGCTLRQVANTIAKKMGQPGVAQISNYSGTFSGNQGSRIMDDTGRRGLSEPYSGSIPSAQDADRTFYTPSDYRSPTGTQQPQSELKQLEEIEQKQPKEEKLTDPKNPNTEQLPTDPKKLDGIDPLKDLPKNIPLPEKTEPSKPEERKEPSIFDNVVDLFTKPKTQHNEPPSKTQRPPEQRGIGNVAEEGPIKTVVQGGTTPRSISSPFALAPNTFTSGQGNSQYTYSDSTLLSAFRTSLDTLQNIFTRISSTFF